MSEFIKIEILCDATDIPKGLEDVIKPAQNYRIGFIRKEIIDMVYPSNDLHTFIETTTGTNLIIRDTVKYIMKHFDE